MAREILTDAMVDDLKGSKSGLTLIWDSHKNAPKGFAVYVTPTDAKTFLLAYRVKKGGKAGGERRIAFATFDRRSNLSPGDVRVSWRDWLKPGTRTPLNVSVAREFARVLSGQIASGFDPLAERQGDHAANKARATAPTVSDLAERFLAWAVEHKRPRSVEEDRLLIEQHIACERRRDGKVIKRYPHKVVLGKIKVMDVERRHIEKLHAEIVHDYKTPVRASLTLALLSKMFSLAKEWGLRDGDNPCAGVERHHAQRRERYLDPATELPRLLAAINKFEDHEAVNAIRLLLFTGARRSEVLKAEWSQFALDVGTWTKPAHSVKQKRTHRTYLSPQAVDLLRRMRDVADNGAKRAEALEREAEREQDVAKRSKLRERARLARARHESPFLFPSIRRPAKAVEGVRSLWRSICAEARLRDFRLHDLRHSYASFLVRRGYTLQMVGDALGHSRVETSARYSHIMPDHARQAATDVGNLIEAAAGGKPRKRGQVVKFPERRP